MEYTINSTVFGNWIITEKIGEGSYELFIKYKKRIMVLRPILH